MVHSLSNLNLTRPGVRRPCLFTILALLVLYDEFNSESLLEHCVVLNLLLDNHLHFDSSAVRFCPNESSINDLDLV
jgi:hypothetical protein